MIIQISLTQMLRIPNLEKRILSYVVEHEDVLAVELDLLAEDFVVDHDQPVPLGDLVQREWNISEFITNFLFNVLMPPGL